MTIRIDGTNTAANPGITGADADTGLQFGTDEVNVVTGGSTRATVDSNGRLLVGTTTAVGSSNAVVIKGTSGTSNGSIYLGNASNASALVAGNTLGFIEYGAADGGTGAQILGVADGTWSSTSDCPTRLVFSTTADSASSPTEHMRLTSAGYLKASTNTGGTGVYSAGTYHALHSNNANWTLAIDNSNSSDPYGILVDFSQAAPDNNIQSFFLGRDSSTDRFRVWADGDCDNHDASYGGFSDEKLKQDIVDAGSQWDDIKSLRVRKFKFKSDVELYGAEARTLIGVVAQETELVSPGLVKDAIDFDDEGNDLGTTTKSVRYSVLYMKAVKALQEAMARIEQLETRVAQLEGGAS